MKNNFSLLLIFFAMSLYAQGPKIIPLSKPSKTRGTDMMTTLWNRSSTTKFDTAEMKIVDISDLLWAANGINRPESYKRTAPSSYNSQDVDIYVFLRSGIYRYEPDKHILFLIQTGDHRNLVSYQQEFVLDSKQILLFVSDISRFQNGEKQDKLDWANIDTGLAAQNVLLFCASNGFLARPRVNMDKNAIREALGLDESQYPILNIPVSYNTISQ